MIHVSMKKCLRPHVENHVPKMQPLKTWTDRDHIKRWAGPDDFNSTPPGLQSNFSKCSCSKTFFKKNSHSPSCTRLRCERHIVGFWSEGVTREEQEQTNDRLELFLFIYGIASSVHEVVFCKHICLSKVFLKGCFTSNDSKKKQKTKKPFDRAS